MPDMTSDTSPADLFTAIDHVGVAVPDLDEAIAFYETTYGMRLVHQEVNEEQGVREAMMAVGDSGSCIQLLAPLNDESTIAKFLDRSGPGHPAAGLPGHRPRRRQRDPARARPAAALRRAAPRHRDSRVNFIHPKDAGGILVELVEPAHDPH